MKLMRLFLGLALFLSGTLGCVDSQLEKNKAIVLRTQAELWSKGDFSVIDELYSPDYIAHWADGSETDRDALIGMIEEARSAFPDMKEEVIHIVAEKDLVVTYFMSTGTFTGTLNGVETSGQKVSRPEIAVHRLKDGKIIEQWTVSDQLTLMKQLGLM